MSPSEGELEAALCFSYKRMVELYAEAVRLADMLPGSIRHGHELEPLLRRIDELVRAAGKLDSQLGSIKEQWTERGCRGGAELQGTVSALAAVIAALAARISVGEEVATAEKVRLLPALEDAARRTRMRQAYGNAESTRRPH